ncbi:DNA recombination protein RmuC [Alicyclobacillus hesperidum]|uniref:DNA recombination protein RmuC n=1 Tax=Alicyclobacillus hesperidum TaxID=89784 RepID=A0A1H2S3K0_9BACL|nr:DNA recombination protein RmuC [Alicyclobacillus hesperidum]GLV13354.1 DNA recombination protein RmuC [Alicyclobacillus hesperidum]SDW26191.1 DNA recombination protein RmuC [Alicyclobacillus hesperidum]
MLNTIAAVISLANFVLLIWLLLGRGGGLSNKSNNGRESGIQFERLERSLRDEIMASREEANRSAREARMEMAAQVQGISQSLARTLADGANSTVQAITLQQQALIDAIGEMSRQQKGMLDSFNKQLADLAQLNASQLEQVREAVERRLRYLQEENSNKLEQMRMTVDEKLHQTLERRLGESFQLVSERLEQVHQGLGEMQSLAAGVGDLKRVLTNVKSRGTMGELQLETLLEQVLSPEQYARNVAIRQDSQERVDFAVRLPGKDDGDAPVWLPIDAKFPLEDYQRLQEAQEAGDLDMFTEAAKALENRIKLEAKSIRDKYIQPPLTTDFALMFLPVEGLFAEVLRRSGLWETLQREYRVIITGPTTITALLNSLQLGFRTLAIQKRSSEVWKLLGAVKSEFGKFGDVLERTQKKLQEASNTIDKAAVRSRAIERQLRSVEASPLPSEPKWLEGEG